MLESQRKFVSRSVSSALIITSSVLTGCQNFEYKAPKLEETLSLPGNVYPFVQDKSHDPIYRAASVTLFTKEGAYGHGSLVRRDGKLYIYTIGHVADVLVVNGDGYVNIPGLENPIRKLDPENFRYHPKSIDYEDPVVSYQVNNLVQQELEGAINKKQITPLEIDTGSLAPNISVVAPRGDTGTSTFLTFNGITRSGALDLGVSNGAVCSGRSGSPILRVAGETMSNKMIGILSAGEVKSLVEDPQGLRSPCFVNVIATPIHNP